MAISKDILFEVSDLECQVRFHKNSLSLIQLLTEIKKTESI